MRSLVVVVCLAASVMLAGSMACLPMASAEPVDGAPLQRLSLLQQVEIDLSGYLEAKSLPVRLESAAQVVSALEGSRNIALHMEVLRRAAQQLSDSERRTLVQAVSLRHKEIPDDVFRYFDTGYAEVLIAGNKTGLFFLRKANDHIKNQFTSLAYAMAQAEVERNIEGGAPDDLTPRKQDVTYKLTDAINRDAEAHMPGFWPAFRAVIQQLRPMGAYTDYTQTDFTQNYLPYGKLPSPTQPTDDTAASTEVHGMVVGEAASLVDVPAACSYPALSAPLPFDRLFRTLTIPLDAQGQTMTAHFFLVEADQPYRAVILDGDQHPLAEVNTPVAPYIFEDLDDDGTPEIVIRQMAQNPALPLVVYRFEGCGFRADETIAALFQ